MGFEPSFAPGRPVWPLAGLGSAELEPDDPDLAIPIGILEGPARELPEKALQAGMTTGLAAHPENRCNCRRPPCLAGRSNGAWRSRLPACSTLRPQCFFSTPTARPC